jgi:hypothetical protein
MRLIESYQDHMDGVVTYELADRRRVRLDARAVREHGVAALLKWGGYELPTERVNVFQNGQIIGTVPADFAPQLIVSKSYFYDPRPGDFRREHDGWVASNILGRGDFDAIPGFIPLRS